MSTTKKESILISAKHMIHLLNRQNQYQWLYALFFNSLSCTKLDPRKVIKVTWIQSFHLKCSLTIFLTILLKSCDIYFLATFTNRVTGQTNVTLQKVFLYPWSKDFIYNPGIVSFFVTMMRYGLEMFWSIGSLMWFCLQINSDCHWHTPLSA